MHAKLLIDVPLCAPILKCGQLISVNISGTGIGFCVMYLVLLLSTDVLSCITFFYVIET